MPAPLLVLQPHGTAFSSPVTINIPYTASMIQSNDKACMIKAESTTSSEWVEYCDGLTFNDGVMTTTLSSFSVVSILVTDLTAPTLSSVSVNSLRRRGTALQVYASADEVCSIYYVILTSGSAPPSPAQVVAGQAADDTTSAQTDPRVPPLVRSSGVLNYDSSSTANLGFTLKVWNRKP
ncbi:hypothetical protein CYMTET_43824 [Cymbomonas tetramitiformis]|uniref:ZU5 domain-containing protein n=1 Tax=Cymbomonas tetramitiformis TaxID=36881 RepID=A0AAE0C2J2_9CHLO|nr:hypothetical protein CYMTET_43824 [Cymbomonas tetramitiformis]